MGSELELVKYFGGGMLVLLPFALYGLFLIEKIIRKLHDSFPSEWDSAGRPSGLFHNPPNINNIQPALSMLKNIAVWLFVTPAWIKGDEILSSCLMKFRVCVFVWNIGILSLMAFIFMSFQEIIFQTL